MKRAQSIGMVDENDDDFEEDSKVILSNENETKSSKKRRRISTKQRLKVRDLKNEKSEVEEGENVRFVALNATEIEENEILFEFAQRFDAIDVIRRVVMLQ